MDDILEQYGQQADAEMEAAKTDEDKIRELAELPPIEYDKQRKDAAADIGCRPQTLDKLVAEARGKAKSDEAASELVSEDEAWSDPVDGTELLRAIVSILRTHAILPKGAETAIALWVVGTYGYDAFRIFPKLLLSSPEKRCGKSTLLEIVRSLSHRALMASNITPSAIFRCIDAWKPTLLIDEADTFVHGNEELRGIINSGHTRSTAYVIRVVGDDYEPKQFSTWAPMVLAMIKLPPDTILDRSVTIPMRRKLPGESITRLPVDFPGECRHLRSKCLRWANDNADTLKAITPTLPSSSNDRALDNWTPLLSIAEAIGGKLPSVAMESFSHLQGAGDDEDDGIGPTILGDIREIFDRQGRAYIKLFGQEIVEKLASMEERPWAEWKHGKPLTTTSLARLLKPFDIRSKRIHIGEVQQRGYEREWFNDAFSRYLSETPTDKASQCHKSSNGAASSDLSKRQASVTGHFETSQQDTSKCHVTDYLTPQKPPKPTDGAASDSLTLSGGVSSEASKMMSGRESLEVDRI
jgi:hypothetical protein